MDSKQYSGVLYVSAIVLMLIMTSCTAAVKPAEEGISQFNNVRTIERNGVLDRERKIWVVFQAPGLSLEETDEWRMHCITKALDVAGLRNYQVADQNIGHYRSGDFKSDYLLVVFLNNLKGPDESSGRNAVTGRWLSLTASVYDFPHKGVVVRLGGSATDTADRKMRNTGDMCSSLIAEIIRSMYAV